MADPISISGMVVSAIQLVDVGVRFCREAHEIYHVGSSAGNRDVQTTTSAFVQATRRLQDELSPLSLSTPPTSKDSKGATPSKDAFEPYEQCILQIAQKCTEIGSELETRLQTTDLGGKRGRMRSLRQAGKNIWKKRSIDQTAELLDKYRRELQTQAALSFEKRRAHDAKEMLGRQQLTEVTMNEALARMESKLEKIEQDQPTVEQRILNSLAFEGISNRIDTVTTAHISTFRWIFKELSTPVHGQVDFTRWLESESGIFWICGKAGSGKSTLVKHICGSERTMTALDDWSQHQYLMTAAFFAWSSGTPLQKTEQGFCRSVLYQLLSGRPGLIQQILPAEYQATQNGAPIGAGQATRSEFREAFTKLARLTSQQSYSAFSSPRICIFLDGLDELDDALDLAKFLQDLTKAHPGFKVVMSGRPLNQFVSMFKGTPQIRVQDLTRDDICKYTESSMKSDAAWCALALKDEDRAKDVLDEVTLKADGVFLWVALVVKSLKAALEEGDTVTELFVILEELPNELEALYKHMFKKMRPRHREQAAQYLGLAETFRTLYPTETLGTFYMSLTEEDYSEFFSGLRKTYLDNWWKFEQCDTMEKRLRGRCCGLLEVHYQRISGSGYNEWQPYIESRVQYLHKSVIDFLAMDGPRELIVKTAGETKFNADLQLAKAHLLQMRGEIWCEMDTPTCYAGAGSYGKWLNDRHAFWRRPCELLIGRMRAEESLQTETNPPLLKQMVSIIRSAPLSVSQCFFDVETLADCKSLESDCTTFFFAVQAGLPSFVRCELSKRRKGDFPPSSVPWLELVYQPRLKAPWRGSHQHRLQVAEILFEHGANLSEMGENFIHRLLSLPSSTKWTRGITEGQLRHLAKIYICNHDGEKWTRDITEDELRHLAKIHICNQDGEVPVYSQQPESAPQIDCQSADSEWLILDEQEIALAQLSYQISKQRQRRWDRIAELLPGLTLGDLQRWLSN